MLLPLILMLLVPARPWGPLLRALEEYPAIHAQELQKLRRGAAGRFVMVRPYHGLGNREHALISAFGLALATRSALFVDWPAATSRRLTPAAVWDLYEQPRFNWTATCVGNSSSVTVKIGGRIFDADVRVSHGTQALLLDANLAATRSYVVRTDNHFLRAVTCNNKVAKSNLFPPDALWTQRILERELLRPAVEVRRRVAEQLSNGECAVGLHLRQIAHTPHDDIWPRLLLILRQQGANERRGLFVAADPDSRDLKQALCDKARKAGIVVLGEDEANATRDTKDGVIDALADNYLLSTCQALVPTATSTFFNIAAVRASARQTVRDVFVCDGHDRNNTAAQPSPLDGKPQPCLFDPFCPDPSIGLPRGSNYYKHGQTGSVASGS